MKAKNKKEVEPIKLVTFDERIRRNVEIVHDNNSATIADTIVDSYKYFNEMNPKYADVNMIDAISSARSFIHGFRDSSSNAYLNIAFTALMSFDEDCANKILPLFNTIIDENIKDKDLREILVNILIHQLKTQSNNVLGMGEDNLFIRRFISNLLNGHHLYVSIIQRGNDSKFIQAAFDQFIMLYFSESIKQWTKLWMDTVLKASVGFTQFGKDIFDADKLVKYGRAAIEYVYANPEVVDQLFAIFNYIVNMVCAFRKMDCTEDLYALDNVSDKIMEQRRDRNNAPNRVSEKESINDNLEELALSLLEDPTIEQF